MNTIHGRELVELYDEDDWDTRKTTIKNVTVDPGNFDFDEFIRMLQITLQLDILELIHINSIPALSVEESETYCGYFIKLFKKMELKFIEFNLIPLLPCFGSNSDKIAELKGVLETTNVETIKFIQPTFDINRGHMCGMDVYHSGLCSILAAFSENNISINEYEWNASSIIAHITDSNDNFFVENGRILASKFEDFVFHGTAFAFSAVMKNFRLVMEEKTVKISPTRKFIWHRTSSVANMRAFYINLDMFRQFNYFLKHALRLEELVFSLRLLQKYDAHEFKVFSELVLLKKHRLNSMYISQMPKSAQWIEFINSTIINYEGQRCYFGFTDIGPCDNNQFYTRIFRNIYTKLNGFYQISLFTKFFRDNQKTLNYNEKKDRTGLITGLLKMPKYIALLTFIFCEIPDTNTDKAFMKFLFQETFYVRYMKLSKTIKSCRKKVENEWEYGVIAQIESFAKLKKISMNVCGVWIGYQC